MKIRHGFVSNSSTSSYLLLVIDGVDAEKIRKTIPDDILNNYSRDPVFFTFIEEYDMAGIEILSEQHEIDPEELMARVEKAKELAKKYFGECKTHLNMFAIDNH